MTTTVSVTESIGTDAVPDETNEPVGRDLMMARMQNGGKPLNQTDIDPPVGRDLMMARMQGKSQEATEAETDGPVGREALFARMRGRR